MQTGRILCEEDGLNVRSVDLYKLMCVQGVTVQSREVLQLVPYLQATNPTNLYKYIESTIIYLSIQTTNLRFLCKPFLKPIFLKLSLIFYFRTCL